MKLDYLEMDFKEFMETNRMGYEVILMKAKGKTYKEIGVLLNRCPSAVRQRERVFLYKILKRYIYFLSLNDIEVDRHAVIDFYQEIDMSIAYLEKEYKDLAIFREGEPPLFLDFFPNLLPYKKLTEDDISEIEEEIVYLRETRNLPFNLIGERMNLTKKKASEIYSHYYHKKIIFACEKLGCLIEKSIKNEVLEVSSSSKKQWDYLCSNYGKILE